MTDTYAALRRRAIELNRLEELADLRELDDAIQDIAWDERNPRVVRKLKSLIGAEVRLIETMALIDGSFLAAGTLFVIQDRARDRLIGWDGSTQTLLRLEWIEPC